LLDIEQNKKGIHEIGYYVDQEHRHEKDRGKENKSSFTKTFKRKKNIMLVIIIPKKKKT